MSATIAVTSVTSLSASTASSASTPSSASGTPLSDATMALPEGSGHTFDDVLKEHTSKTPRDTGDAPSRPLGAKRPRDKADPQTVPEVAVNTRAIAPSAPLGLSSLHAIASAAAPSTAKITVSLVASPTTERPLAGDVTQGVVRARGPIASLVPVAASSPRLSIAVAPSGGEHDAAAATGPTTEAMTSEYASNVKESARVTTMAHGDTVSSTSSPPVTDGRASRQFLAPVTAKALTGNSALGRDQLAGSTAPSTPHVNDRPSKSRTHEVGVTPVARVAGIAPGKLEHNPTSAPEQPSSGETRVVATPLPSVSAISSTAKTSVAAPVMSTTSSVAHSLDVGKLAGAISRPVGEGDGSYTLVVTMHPAELGHVQAVVTLDHRDLQVSITPQTVVGHDALASSVDALKQELARGGVNVNVTLHDHGASPDAEQRDGSSSPRGILTNAAGSGTERPDAPTAATAGQIHLIL